MWHSKNSAGTWGVLTRARHLDRDHIRARALFNPDGFWWKRLPANPPTAANNTNMRATIRDNMTDVNLDRTSYTPRVVVATNSDPVVTFTYDASSGYAEHPDLISTQLTGIRIPTDAAPAAGTDKEIVIYNRDTCQMTDIWNATKVDDLNWKASWAGTIQDTRASDGVHANPFGAVASGLAFVPGMVMPDELRDGWIGHVIGVGIRNLCLNSEVSAPATRTDGTGTGTNLLSEGQRLFLPRSLDIDALPMGRVGKVIARAAQEYGFIIWDLGPSTAFTIRALNATGMTEDPYPAILTDVSPDDPLAGFPIDQLHVMPMNWMP